MTHRSGERAAVWLIQPHVPYAAVHAAAVDDGWAGGPVTLTPPLLRDEPEVARFRRHGTVATYELDPVAMLRRWRSPVRPPASLPLVHREDVLAALDQTGAADCDESLLRAVLGAGEWRLAEALPRLLAIRRRRLPPVVADAVEASLNRIAQCGGTRRRT